MPVPSGIENVSTTPSSNNPPGTESPTAGDDYLRTYAAFIKQLVSKGSDIASASTITPPSTASVFVLTGSTPVTTIGNTNSWLGREITLILSGAVPFTHSASLVMPGAANYTGVAGDILKFVQDTTGVWRCSSLRRGTLSDVTALAIQNQSYTYGTTAGTSTAYTLTVSPAVTSYQAGQRFSVNFHTGNGLAPTISINGLAAIPLHYQNSSGATTNVVLSTIPAGLVTDIIIQAGPIAVVQSPVVNAASQTNVGTIRTATNLEAILGSNTGIALSPANLKAAQIAYGTAQATTSGTTFDFLTGGTVNKRRTVYLNGVSLSGTDNLMFQFLVGGVAQTGSYSGYVTRVGAASSSYTAWSTGANVTDGAAAANTYSGKVVFELADPATNTWSITGNLTATNAANNGLFFTGTRVLSGAPNGVRMLTTGANTFDAGSANDSVE